jgi:hypothetical protein
MGANQSPDPHSLTAADERSLELLRHELVINGDDRREMVIDELLRRGAAAIADEATHRGREQGHSRQQIASTSEEAAAILAMRLRTTARLKPITLLARELTRAALGARAPECERPARLVAPPTVRKLREQQPDGADQHPPRAAKGASIEAQLADALRRGMLKRNDPESS